jgi:hypothetical protein
LSSRGNPRGVSPGFCARLEEFNKLSRWILDENLLAARPLDGLASELDPTRGQRSDRGSHVPFLTMANGGPQRSASLRPGIL